MNNPAVRECNIKHSAVFWEREHGMVEQNPYINSG